MCGARFACLMMIFVTNYIAICRAGSRILEGLRIIVCKCSRHTAIVMERVAFSPNELGIVHEVLHKETGGKVL